MKRTKSAIYLQIGIVLTAALLLSACAAEKRAPQNHAPPNRGEYLIADKMSTLEITAPAELGFMVKGACAGAACGLLAQVDNKTAPAAAQCPFPVTATTPEPASDRQAGSESAVDNSDDVEAVKQAVPVGAYSSPKERPDRALPNYERK